MKKRVLFVKAANPTRFNKLLTFPLGLMYIASYLRSKRKDVEIRIFDMRVSSEDLLYSTLKEFSPDIVGISAITVERDSLSFIAKRVKEFRRDCIVIAGGPHPTAFLDEVLDDRNIDYVISGEGEVAFFELFNTIVDGGDINNIKGVGFREGEEKKFVPRKEYIDPLDNLPFPAWDLVVPTLYYRRTSMSNYGIRRYANILTSRSCPYRCIYCHNIFGKGFRARSAENVIEEIKYLSSKYNIEEVEIVDDVFNFDIKRAKDFFNLSQKNGVSLKYSFPNGLRGDRLDEELIKIMKDSGTVMVTIAVESASKRIQKMIRKNLDLQKTSQFISLFDRTEILTRGFFMLGFPEETEEEIKETIDFACSSSLHIGMFYLPIPFKGTELYDMVRNRIDFRGFSTEDFEYVSSRFNVSRIEYNRLKELQASAYRRFYANPKRWWKILKLSPYKKDLLRYIPDLFLRIMLDRQ